MLSNVLSALAVGYAAASTCSDLPKKVNRGMFQFVVTHF
jgi:hypothetical protein